MDQDFVFIAFEMDLSGLGALEGVSKSLEKILDVAREEHLAVKFFHGNDLVDTAYLEAYFSHRNSGESIVIEGEKGQSCIIFKCEVK